MAQEIPAHHGLLTRKSDVSVLWRLAGLMRRQRIDAVVTVGAGDKMFWGRLAARLAGVPVIASALHSTGWPDRVQLANRLLAPITDAFIAVAEPHGRYLAAHEGCTASKIQRDPQRRRRGTIPAAAAQRDVADGVRPAGRRSRCRASWPRCGRKRTMRCFCGPPRACSVRCPSARFLIVGDGPQRGELEALAELARALRRRPFPGHAERRAEVLSLIDVLALTSHMEANPVSILEAMAAGKPVVATRVGSVDKAVEEGRSGYLVTPGSEEELAGRLIELLRDRAGRRLRPRRATVRRRACFD